jgi:putative transposase
MRRIDEAFLRYPFYGRRRMREWLRTQGHAVNAKRVGRLMRLMGLEAIYPKPRLSVGGVKHRKFPYLLRGVTIDRSIKSGRRR